MFLNPALTDLKSGIKVHVLHFYSQWAAHMADVQKESVPEY